MNTNCGSGRMFASKRQQEIVNRLQRDGHVTTNDLTESLQVSAVTIRRDLQALEEQGVLRRSYGGAILVNNDEARLDGLSAYAAERTLAEKAKIEHTAKARIGQAAANLVEAGETIKLE